ncbi:MAG: F0F1 ATP synthase subunit alpha, partial [Verrucomicrobia bacterium]|nr:F0F1 ATP synthase subunit alpha [Verrucomicrobiota bacterium]
MSSILQEIEQHIAGVTSSVEKTNVGTVRQVGDGVAKVEGLSDVMLNEMIEFDGGVTGMALNLEESEVGVVLLGDYTEVKEGSQCRTTGKLLSIPVGESVLGRVVNALGQPIDGKGAITAAAQYPMEKIAPGIIKRKSVSVPVQTGIMAVDAMIPIGRGQRELIIGDRATGKTTIAVDTIISQAQQNKAAEQGKLQNHKPLYCIFVAIGQKLSNIARIHKTLEDAGAMEYTTIVSASASDAAAMQFLAPYAGCALAEYL